MTEQKSLCVQLTGDITVNFPCRVFIHSVRFQRLSVASAAVAPGIVFLDGDVVTPGLNKRYDWAPILNPPTDQVGNKNRPCMYSMVAGNMAPFVDSCQMNANCYSVGLRFIGAGMLYIQFSYNPAEGETIPL
jgi:hypothetical protein